MTAPRLGQGMPADDSWVARKLEDMQRQINELRAARTLDSATVGAGGISSENFDGMLDPATAGTAGWGLSGTDGTAIFNQIILRNGIIGDDALTNPLSPAVVHQQASSFALGTTVAEVCRVDVAVPAGFTRALVVAAAGGSARNSTGSLDYFAGYIDIAGINIGIDSVTDVAAGQTGGLTNVGTALLPSLSTSFYIRAMFGSGLASWSADPFNTVNVDGMVLFLR